MKTIDKSNPEWNLLGELELHFSSHAEGDISTWLEEILEPLRFPADLRLRIFSSAQEAVRRVMQSNNTVLEINHVHLLILITPNHSLEGKPWGFFRIEKMDGAGKDHNPHDHSIEFYLYADV